MLCKYYSTTLLALLYCLGDFQQWRYTYRVDFRRFKMFEQHMDEYLDEEIESLKQAFELVCKEWDKSVRNSFPNPNGPRSISMPTFHLTDINTCITWCIHARTTESLPQCAESGSHEAHSSGIIHRYALVARDHSPPHCRCRSSSCRRGCRCRRNRHGPGHCDA